VPRLKIHEDGITDPEKHKKNGHSSEHDSQPGLCQQRPQYKREGQDEVAPCENPPVQGVNGFRLLRRPQWNVEEKEVC